jgi:hypothetical protein
VRLRSFCQHREPVNHACFPHCAEGSTLGSDTYYITQVLDLRPCPFATAVPSLTAFNSSSRSLPSNFQSAGRICRALFEMVLKRGKTFLAQR